jgi:hypothetical protein
MDNRASVGAAYRAYAIDQAHEKVREIERGTVTPAMRRIETEDPDRHLAGLDNRLKGRDRRRRCRLNPPHKDQIKLGRYFRQSFPNQGLCPLHHG